MLARSSVRHAVSIALLAFAVRLALFVVSPVASPAWDGVIYERAASQLARGEGYTQRILREDAPARPSAFYPPGYPLVLSVGRRIAAGGELDLALQTLAGIISAIATYFFARRFASPRISQIAGSVVALCPSLALLSLTWLSEPWFVALLAVGWTTLARARHPSAYFAAGLLLGASSLVRPLALLIVAFGVLFLVRRAHVRRSISRSFWRLCAFAIGAAVVVAPWTFRNARSLDAPAIVSTNGGANLLLGTIGDGLFPASGSIPPALDCPNGMREVARDRCRESRAKDRIAADPIAYAKLGVIKAAHTFGYEVSAPMAWAAGTHVRIEMAHALAALATLSWWLVVVLAAMSARRERSLASWCLPPLVATAALHIASLGGDRYHLALWPFAAAMAAVSIPNACRRVRQLRTRALHA